MAQKRIPEFNGGTVLDKVTAQAVDLVATFDDSANLTKPTKFSDLLEAILRATSLAGTGPLNYNGTALNANCPINGTTVILSGVASAASFSGAATGLTSIPLAGAATALSGPLRGNGTGVTTGSSAISEVTGLQTALDLKAPLASPTFTGTVTVPDSSFTIAKTSGLQTALDLKAPLASPTFTGTVTVPDSSFSIAKTSGLQASLDLKATAANPVFTGTVTIPDNALAIADTSGLQAALDGKQPLDSDLTAIAALTTTAFGRSLLELANAGALLAAAGAAASVHSHAQSDVTGLVAALALKAPLASPTFTGTVTVPDTSFTIAKTSGLQAALDTIPENIPDFTTGAPSLNWLYWDGADLSWFPSGLPAFTAGAAESYVLNDDGAGGVTWVPAGVYDPANSAHWDGDPATIAEALDRIAAAVGGVVPIP